MIGVVLWRDAADDKAVIWCEDQGDLAFLDCKSETVAEDQGLDVGDVVRFDITIVNDLRLAKNAVRLMDNWGKTLSNALSGLPEEPAQSGRFDRTEVIPFRRPKEAAWQEGPGLPQRRLG